MSVEDHIVSFSLEVNVEKAYENVRRLETLLYRTLGLVRRMGLPDAMEDQIRDLQRLLAAVNSLRLAYIALQAARMAAGDPIAWGMAAVSGASIAMTADEWLYDMRRGSPL